MRQVIITFANEADKEAGLAALQSAAEESEIACPFEVQSATRDNQPDPVPYLVNRIGEHFRTFGGGRCNQSNPISIACKDGPLTFAAGVDVADVVQFVLKHTETIWGAQAVLADVKREEGGV